MSSKVFSGLIIGTIFMAGCVPSGISTGQSNAEPVFENSKIISSEEVTLRVLDDDAPCSGVGEQTCYVIETASGEKEYFYGDIVGLHKGIKLPADIMVTKLTYDASTLPADVGSVRYIYVEEAK